jgi:hypothetical protein
MSEVFDILFHGDSLKFDKGFVMAGIVPSTSLSGYQNESVFWLPRFSLTTPSKSPKFSPGKNPFIHAPYSTISRFFLHNPDFYRFWPRDCITPHENKPDGGQDDDIS